jgi:hypothetical protein
MIGARTQAMTLFQRARLSRRRRSSSSPARELERHPRDVEDARGDAPRDIFDRLDGEPVPVGGAGVARRAHPRPPAAEARRGVKIRFIHAQPNERIKGREGATNPPAHPMDIGEKAEVRVTTQ